MSWTDDDMKLLMQKLPAVKIGLYSGVHSGRNAAGERIVGRICILAKDGRFARFDGKDPEMDGSNEVDYEALQLLARWPKPRLWLSDGFVCGGLHSGPPKYHPMMGFYNHQNGRIHELCDAWMKAHEILRVPNQATMHKLLKREKVRLYRTTTPHPDDATAYGDTESLFPIKCEPVVFQL